MLPDFAGHKNCIGYHQLQWSAYNQRDNPNKQTSSNETSSHWKMLQYFNWNCIQNSQTSQALSYGDFYENGCLGWLIALVE